MGPSADQLNAGGATWSRRMAFAVGSLLVVPAAIGCDAYGDINPGAPSTQRPEFESVWDGGRSNASMLAGTEAGVPTPVDARGCDSGECWWSKMRNGCYSAGMPTAGDRPEPEARGDAPEPAAVGDIYLGFTRIRLDAAMGSMPSGSIPGQDIGLDLDGVCTGATTCPGQIAGSCRSQAGVPPTDGAACRDNAFASVLAIASGLPLLGEQFGSSEDIFNCGLWRGTYNFIARISGYNGRANDDKVRVDWYTSSGLVRPQGFSCPSENFNQQYPIWRASSPWGVLESGLSGPIAASGKLPNSTVADKGAYVRDGYLVARFPEGATLRLAGDAKPFRGFALTMHGGVYLGRLSRAQDTTWRLTDGLVAGSSRPAEVVRSFRQVGFCAGTGLDLLYETFVRYAQDHADVLASGERAPETPCDAMSFGIAFDAAQLTPGGVGHAEPLVECCPPGVTAEDCRDSCGNGTVTGDELCDVAIPEGQPGACPKRCPTPQRSCERVTLQGSGCMAQCVTAPITDALNNDGCCPGRLDAKQDSDCPPMCGNGVLEPGESCDPASECLACASNNACLPAIASGSDCHAVCRYDPVTQCRNADGCCPAGCTRSTDNDCSASCGNRLIDRGETCEANSAVPCPTSCDDGDACTNDVMTGSAANCNLVCEHTAITARQGGDGCCPTGADSEDDSDCTPVCGNERTEEGEQCDDGNLVAGDGCSAACQLEGSLGECLKDLKASDKCALCACRKCQAEAKACFGAPNPQDVELCSDLAACALDVGCHGAECYCGTADLFRCTYGVPNGPCRREIERAARTNGVSAISFRSNDPSYPLGRADALWSCVDKQCAAECGL